MTAFRLCVCLFVLAACRERPSTHVVFDASVPAPAPAPVSAAEARFQRDNALKLKAYEADCGASEGPTPECTGFADSKPTDPCQIKQLACFSSCTPGCLTCNTGCTATCNDCKAACARAPDGGDCVHACALERQRCRFHCWDAATRCRTVCDHGIEGCAGR